MKKTLAIVTILLITLSTFVVLVPRQAASSSSSWTLKQLTKNDVDDVLSLYPISRDGKKIVFDRRPPNPLNWDIYEMNVSDEPGQEKQMTVANGRDIGAKISGDGSIIAFESNRFNPSNPWDLEIFSMNFTDNPGQEIQVTDSSTYLDSDLAISGGGKIIAWHSGSSSTGPFDILVLNMTDKSLTRIDAGQWDEYPSVSYDGRKIAFTEVYSGDVYLVNSDGTGLRQITNTPEREDRWSLISGDGTKIAFRRMVGGNYEIFVYDIVDDVFSQLTNNNVDDWLGSINYDGTIVAYDRGGHIYIHDMTHETQLTDGPYTDECPRLDGDGNTIAFRSRGRDGSDTEIFAMTSPLSATVDIDPDTLNLKSNGQWITAYITLPDACTVEDIVLETVCLDGIPAAWSEIQDGVYMIKFDRATVQASFTNEPDYDSAPKFYDITLAITGNLVDGTPFEGSDTIRVLSK
jgi:Tol biopolymer transport system component